MKTSKARLDWREGRRRRAWELKQAGWKQQDIAAALGVTSGAVSQWLTRARVEGVEEGLRRHPAPGPTPKLTLEQLAQLPALLDRGAEAYGFRGQVWTCKRVGEGIRRTFGVTYDPSHISRLLHRLSYSVQRPIERATQRDEGAIRIWWEQRWPALKKRPTTKHR
jgi:transposase